MAANPDSAALQSLIANYQAAQTVKGTWEQVKAAFSAVQQNLPAFSKSITTVCESLETMASQIEAALTATGGSVDPRQPRAAHERTGALPRLRRVQ